MPAMDSTLHGPGLVEQSATPWVDAMQAQLHGLKLLEYLLQGKDLSDLPHWMRALVTQWEVDHKLVSEGVPFVWSPETTAAAMAAAPSIPGETVVNAWNLETNAAWWYFTEPLQVQTVTDVDSHIHALSFGWVSSKHVRDANIQVPKGPRAFVMTCWIPDPRRCDDTSWSSKYGGLMPSQVWTWFDGETLDQMLERVRAEHRRLYGPGGRYAMTKPVGEVVFLNACTVLSRFVMAGFIWMNQKVLVTGEGVLPRQRRKEYVKLTKSGADAVKVIQLRRAERVQALPSDNPDKTEWACRWEVDGHWRNQACGPRFSERRLTWIHPFLKGPEDKPLRVPQRKVYMVNR